MDEGTVHVCQNRRRFGVLATLMFLILLISATGMSWLPLGAAAENPKEDWLGEPTPEPSGDWGSGWINDTVFDQVGVDCRNPAIATGPGSILHATVSCNVVVGAWNIYYATSNDGGENWGGWSLVAGAPVNETNPDIAVHPDDGRIFITYEKLVGAGNRDIYLAYSDDGNLWNEVTVGSFGDDEVEPTVQVEYDYSSPNYYVWVAYESRITLDNRNVLVYRSGDRGDTWTQQLNHGIVDQNTYAEPDMCYQQGADLQDRLFLVFKEGVDRGDMNDITLMVSEDDGSNWLGPFSLATHTSSVSYPTIACSRDGDRVIAAWQVNAADAYIRYAYDHDPTTPDTWNAPLIRGNTDGNGYDDLAPKLIADGEGTPSESIGGNFTLIWTEGGSDWDIVASTVAVSAGAFSTTFQITDMAGFASASYPSKGLTTRLGPDDGGWYPAAVFVDFRAGPYNAMYTTSGMRSSVKTNPSGLDVSVDSVIYVGGAFFNWPAGYSHLLTAPTPQSVSPGVQYAWVSWSDGGLQTHSIMAGATDVNYTANYVLQYEYTIDTSPPGLGVEVDGVPYPAAPVTFWWDDGSPHDVYAPSPQSLLPGTQYIFNSWSDGGGQSHQINATAPTTLVANFDTQHWIEVLAFDTTNALPLNGVQVTVNAAPFGVTPASGWLLEGVSVDIGVEDPYFDGVNTYSFVNWSTGSANNPLPYVPIGPDMITANYVQAPSDYFTFQVTPATQMIAPGDVATYTVTIDSINGYTGAVSLNASSAPPGLIPPATANFAPNPVTVPSGGQVTSTLTIDNTAGVPDATYTITVNGDDGAGTSWSNTTELVVATPTFDVTAVPGIRNIAPGMSTTYDITVSSVNNYAGSVDLSATAAPPGLLPPANATFMPATVIVPAGGSATSTLTIDNTAGVPDDTYTITIQGDDGVTTDTFNVDLIIATVPMFSIDATPALRQINPGSVTSFTLTATSVNSYAGNVDVSVAHALTAADATLSWDKTTLVVPAGGADSAVLTISTTSSIPARDYALTFYGDDGVDNRSDQSTLNITAVVDGSISGTVTDQNGDPIDDADVELLDGTNVIDTTTTNNNGRYTFSHVDAGTYTVRASKTGYDDDTRAVTITAANPDKSGIDLELRLITYTIEGDLEDEDTGDPISGATVEVYDENGDLVGSDTTSSNGHFAISDLLPGTYTVIITADGYDTIEQDIVITDRDEDMGSVGASAKAQANFLSDYWWLILLIIIVVVVVIIVALVAKRKKPSPEEVLPGTYAEAQMPAEESPPYQAPPEQQPYQPPPEAPPEEPEPGYPPEAPPEE